MVEKIVRKAYDLVALKKGGTKKGESGYFLEIHDKSGFKYHVGYNSKKAAQDGLKIYGAKSEKVSDKA